MASRTSPLRRILVLTAALLLTVGVFGLAALLRSEPTAKFCTAEGLLGPDGEMYGRSHAHDCAFVDEEGQPLPTDADGDVVFPE